MIWSEIRLGISLAERPAIVQMGFANHGKRKEETYRFDCWTLHIYYYTGNIRVNGKNFPIRFGYMGVNPPGAETVYQYSEPSCRHIWIHFKVATKESRHFIHQLPMMYDVNSEFTSFNSPMEEMFRCYKDEPLRAETILWAQLFRLAKFAENNSGSLHLRHAAINAAMEYIEKNLGQSLPTEDILKVACLSHNHLNRLFTAAVGKTIREYILDRRMEKAAYYLRSTHIPVKVAASECGIPDLHHFNKTVRGYFGMSPTRLRNRKQGRIP